MNKDYSYCLVKTACLHRRGCRRYLGNYSEAEIASIDDYTRISTIDFKDCIPDYQNMNCENDFTFLDRFTLSTGEDFER